MGNNRPTQVERVRGSEVDMSSEAISRRLREVSELNQLGLSLAKAKPCPASTDELPKKLREGA